MRLSKNKSKIIARQKWRHYYPRELRALVWGVAGIKLLGHLVLLRRRLKFLKLWLKWHYKTYFLYFLTKKKRSRFKKIMRFYWLHIKRCTPCSKKSNAMRMGKGRGKVVGWFGRLNAGNFLLEFNKHKLNISKNFYKYFFKKLGVHTHYVETASIKNYTNITSKTQHKPYCTVLRHYTYKKYIKSIRGVYLRKFNYLI